MRRGHIVRGITIFCLAASVGFGIAAGTAGAASPADICAAIAGGTFNAANYSASELAAYQQALQSDTTIQGYCSPLVFVPATTTTVTTGGTTTVQSETTTVLNGTTTVLTVPATGAAGVAGASGPATTTSEVAGASAEKTAPAGQAARPGSVAGAQKTKSATPSASPLAASKQQGGLPFTGAELAVFAVVGAALLAGGLLLRLTGGGGKGARR